MTNKKYLGVESLATIKAMTVQLYNAKCRVISYPIYE